MGHIPLDTRRTQQQACVPFRVIRHNGAPHERSSHSSHAGPKYQGKEADKSASSPASKFMAWEWHLVGIRKSHSWRRSSHDNAHELDAQVSLTSAQIARLRRDSLSFTSIRSFPPNLILSIVCELDTFIGKAFRCIALRKRLTTRGAGALIG